MVAFALMGAGCGLGGKEANPHVADRTRDVSASLLGAQVDLRKVVFTSDLTVRVADAASATQQATRVARDAGGLVFAQSSDLEGRKETRLTLKVPPDRFESVLTGLSELGRALKREIKAQDVTEQYVDVDGRLRTAQASVDRLRGLLGDARSTSDIVAVEAELAKREGEIESLQGRLRVLSSQVDFATVNLRLTERGDIEVTGEVPAFLKALRAGWVAVLNVVLVVVAVAGFSVPFVPFAVLGWWAVRRYRRRSPPVTGDGPRVPD